MVWAQVSTQPGDREDPPNSRIAIHLSRSEEIHMVERTTLVRSQDRDGPIERWPAPQDGHHGRRSSDVEPRHVRQRRMRGIAAPHRGGGYLKNLTEILPERGIQNEGEQGMEEGRAHEDEEQAQLPQH